MKPKLVSEAAIQLLERIERIGPIIEVVKQLPEDDQILLISTLYVGLPLKRREELREGIADVEALLGHDKKGEAA